MSSQFSMDGMYSGDSRGRSRIHSAMNTPRSLSKEGDGSLSFQYNLCHTQPQCSDTYSMEGSQYLSGSIPGQRRGLSVSKSNSKKGGLLGMSPSEVLRKSPGTNVNNVMNNNNILFINTSGHSGGNVGGASPLPPQNEGGLEIPPLQPIVEQCTNERINTYDILMENPTDK
jgi:hypothetical protein